MRIDDASEIVLLKEKDSVSSYNGVSPATQRLLFKHFEIQLRVCCSKAQNLRMLMKSCRRALTSYWRRPPQKLFDWRVA